MNKVNSKLRLGVLAACSLLAANQLSANEIADFESGADFNIPTMSTQDMSDGLIIKYKSNASPMSERALANRARAKVKFNRKMFNGASVYKLDRAYPNIELESLVLDLANDPTIESVEIDRRMYPLLTPNDQYYNVQWHYTNTQAGINAPAAWDLATGAGVNVAVIDTGITNHSDLNANIVGGYDFISNTTVANDGGGRDSNPSDPGDWTTGQCGPASNSSWHGTHVAGTVAAVTNNSTGVAGVAFGSKVVPIRALGTCGGLTSDIADSIVWASGGSVTGAPSNPNPAKVINLSLGGGGSCASTSQTAINQAVANGSVVVVAAGNSNSNVANFTPASCNNVISVAATNRQSNRASYSNFGSLIDIAAPGGEGGSDGVASTVNSGTTTPSSESYAYYAGTSMAAPHVAAVAAMMLEVNPSLTPAEIESLLKSSAKSFPSGSSCNTSNCGDGMLDALAAIQAAQSGTEPPPPPPPPAGDGVLSNGVAETNLSGSTGNEQFFTLEVPAGATNLSFVMSGGSGDADLYVRFGAKPTSSTWDCRPYLSGNSETCNISNVQAGTYHVMIRAYSSYSGVSLVGSFDEPAPPPPPSDGGSATLTDLSASRGNWLHYTLDLPAGMSNLTAAISGGSGDADLYVRRGTRPTTSAYDCRPYRSGNNETCSFNNPAQDTWHISIRAYRSFSGVTLQVDWE